MKPTPAEALQFLNGRVTLHAGDCRAILSGMKAGSIDACVTDPPYHLTGGFMGKEWDGGDVAFRPETWAAVLRVLKPGAHLVAFAAPKNGHRLACAIEDAGFEIRDTLAWIFGSGFPKSHNIAKALDGVLGTQAEGFNTAGGGLPPIRRKELRSDNPNYKPFEGNSEAARQWQGWGTALKPAYEPIILARKPLIGTVAANVLKHGVGAINIDACRVATDDEAKPRHNKSADDYFTGKRPITQIPFENGGRWPANVIHDGSEEVVEAFPETASGSGVRRPNDWSTDVYGMNGRPSDYEREGDSGSAARFFYTAKADSDDRIGSKHPTVKPLDLMQYLVRLITPPRGVILDPFAGTGTTGEAAWREGFSAVLIEREAEYLADIERRMALALAGPDERARESIKARLKDKPQDHGPLFSEVA